MTLLLLLFITPLATARHIEVFNKCPFTTWVGILGPGNPEGGGFKLDAGQRRSVNVADDWKSGRIWPRTWCDDNFNCATGFCDNREQCNGKGGRPPATLAEFTLRGDAGKDFYDVSLVDGYNIPVLIDPQGGHGDCKRAGGCFKDVNEMCPGHLAVKKDGRTVGCKSGCFALNTDEECCRGQFGPQNCHPKETAHIFKDACPTAYSYAYDDGTSTFTCTDANYVVQFC